MFSSIYPGGKAPSPWMQAWLITHFGSETKFRQFWKFGSKSIFGSGWCWLIMYGSYPVIVPSMLEANPLGRENLFPICVMDLWENSFVLDYGINKNHYIDNWMESMNWAFIEETIRNVPLSKQITRHVEANIPRVDERREYNADVSPVNPYLLEAQSYHHSDTPSIFSPPHTRIPAYLEFEKLPPIEGEGEELVDRLDREHGMPNIPEDTIEEEENKKKSSKRRGR